MKKALPIILLVVMAVIAISLRRCNQAEPATKKTTSTTQSDNAGKGKPAGLSNESATASHGLDRNPDKFFFTKHARCRMECRHITQREVKAILKNGTINYNKSDLQDSRGPSYAVEGITEDRQRVRIIFAPKQRHMSVVTVIDLDKEYVCNCD